MTSAVIVSPARVTTDNISLQQVKATWEQNASTAAYLVERRADTARGSAHPPSTPSGAC